MDWLTSRNRKNVVCIVAIPCVIAWIYANIDTVAPIMHIIALSVLYLLFVNSGLDILLMESVAAKEAVKETFKDELKENVTSGPGTNDERVRQKVIHGTALTADYINKETPIFQALFDGGLVVSLRHPRVWRMYITTIELFLREYYNGIMKADAATVDVLITKLTTLEEMGKRMTVTLAPKYMREVTSMTNAIELDFSEKIAIIAHQTGRVHKIARISSIIARNSGGV